MGISWVCGCGFETDDTPALLAHVEAHGVTLVTVRPDRFEQARRKAQRRAAALDVLQREQRRERLREFAFDQDEQPEDECPTCDRGLRGSSPTCIDCQLVEALKGGADCPAAQDDCRVAPVAPTEGK